MVPERAQALLKGLSSCYSVAWLEVSWYRTLSTSARSLHSRSSVHNQLNDWEEGESNTWRSLRTLLAFCLLLHSPTSQVAKRCPWVHLHLPLSPWRVGECDVYCFCLLFLHMHIPLTNVKALTFTKLVLNLIFRNSICCLDEGQLCWYVHTKLHPCFVDTVLHCSAISWCIH